MVTVKQLVLKEVKSMLNRQKYISKFRYHNNQGKGFGLIEILVALVIFSVAMLGLLPLLINYMRTNVINDIRNDGNYVMQRVINDIKSTKFDNITNDNRTLSFNGRTFQASWEVAEDNSSFSQMKSVSVILTWQKPYNKGTTDNLTSQIFIRKE